MSSAQLYYNSKPVSALARRSYISSSVATPEQKPSQPSPQNALVQTIYKNLRQKRLFVMSEKVLLAAVNSYTPVAHHFLSATEEFVNDVFQPADMPEDLLICDEMDTQQEDQNLATHSAQVICLCGARALQYLPRQRVHQISNTLKLVGNSRWTPVPFSKLALKIDEYLAPSNTTADDHPDIIDDTNTEHSLTNPANVVECEEVQQHPVNPISSPSIREFDYCASSQSTSSMIFHDVGPYRVDSDACSITSLPPSTSSLLSVTDSLSTTECDMKDWHSRKPSLPLLTSEQSWLGKSTQTVVTVTDATGRFINDKKVSEIFN
ncbi:hypothetical protein K493DRAFT_336538 [Basidiobolus meristosporus CBS 931.73]|uniref:Uncharacterized protein n=1 Tax=Basidiobolus meristosporus CBS 931.73 TaxID=1314790 RepID=A0A1Y1YHX5_9FUNG|nr:hypothetical protein K493DRAFT_336538 [Basidiobolus meristosporus CBS 931.73]|eukprot:ORX97483.1 hypothetical protein K493DRAFT_336538 [Basidiobolus meristosporus CBS 931.73]